jgi:hypothetical protein
MQAEQAAADSYISRWRPSSVSPPAAAFARGVIRQAAPAGRERAKNLLWAAGKLADYALGLGLEPAPEVVLHPSVAESSTFFASTPARARPADRDRAKGIVLRGRRASVQPVGQTREGLSRP